MLCMLIHELCNIHMHFSTSSLPEKKRYKIYTFNKKKKKTQQSQTTIPNRTSYLTYHKKKYD